MLPLLFQSSDGSWSIASYPVFLIFGWLCAAWYIRVCSTRLKFNHPRKFYLFWVAALFSWVGGRFIWVVFHHEVFSQESSSLFVWDAGQSSPWAGLWILIVTSILGCIKYRIAVLHWLDFVVPAWLLVQVFERFGAFLSGGDFGLTTNRFWGVQFPKGSPADEFHRNEMIGVAIPEHVSFAVHPVQLYGALTMIAMVLIVWYLQSRSTPSGTTPSRSVQAGAMPRGTIFKVSMLGYATSRLFFEDPFKLSRSPDVIGSIRGDQFMSIAVIVTMVLLLRRGGPRSAQRGKKSSVSDRKSRSRN